MSAPQPNDMTGIVNLTTPNYIVFCGPDSLIKKIKEIIEDGIINDFSMVSDFQDHQWLDNYNQYKSKNTLFMIINTEDFPWDDIWYNVRNRLQDDYVSTDDAFSILYDTKNYCVFITLDLQLFG